MKRAFGILLAVMMSIAYVSAQEALPKYMQIEKKSVSAGIDGYATASFALCGDSSAVEGRIVYIPEYVNKSALLSIYLKDNGAPAVVRMKSLIAMLQKEASKTSRYERKKSITYTVRAYPEDIWTNNNLIGDLAYALVGYQWDDQDEEDYIFISIPLHVCRSIKHNKDKNYAKKFREQLRESYISSVEISCDFERYTIPFGFPLNLTIDIMETLYKEDK